jgi:hypothetical protein
MGHHVAFHMNPSFPNHDAELKADYFAGFFTTNDYRVCVSTMALALVSAFAFSTARRLALGNQIGKVSCDFVVTCPV